MLILCVLLLASTSPNETPASPPSDVSEARPGPWGEPSAENAGGDPVAAPRRKGRVTMGYDALSVSVQSNRSTELSLEYEPNSAFVLGAQVGYGPLTVFAWVNAGTLEDERTFGDTSAFDLAAAWTTHLGENELNVFAEFRRYKGFYLANTGELFVGGSNDFPLVRGDIASTAATVTGTYFFDEDFSYSDAFYDAIPGRASNGSWVVRVTTGLIGFSAAAPLVPQALIPAFGGSGFVSESNALILSGSGGYAYDWVREGGFFLTGMVLGGWSIGYRVGTEGEENGFSDSYAASAAVATGWAGERYSGGVTGEAILDGIGFDDLDVAITRLNATVFFEVKL